MKEISKFQQYLNVVCDEDFPLMFTDSDIENICNEIYRYKDIKLIRAYCAGARMMRSAMIEYLEIRKGYKI